MITEELIRKVEKELLQAGLPMHNESTNYDKLKGSLAQYINYLIESDFNAFIQLLYSLDIEEDKVRNQLQFNTVEAPGELIASLIIERQLQKLKYRNQYINTNAANISEEEKW